MSHEANMRSTNLSNDAIPIQHGELHSKNIASGVHEVVAGQGAHKDIHASREGHITEESKQPAPAMDIWSG